MVTDGNVVLGLFAFTGYTRNTFSREKESRTTGTGRLN